ncbi:MAG TPA: glutamate-1-semialdehyde 2,1-aminomutase [Acidimicrobiales bacterium]
MRDFRASNEHTAAVTQLVPGGAHTYAKGEDQYPGGMAPVIERGSGCRVWDIDGNEYVEYGSGLRSVTLGHAHPAVNDAVRESIEGGINFARPHRLELDAAERMVELIPSAEMVKFGLSGSDATTAALKLARAHTGRPMVAVCRQQPFFSTDDWFIVTTPMSAGILPTDAALTVQFDYNDLDSIEKLFTAHPDRIAAVILEAETTEPPAPGFFAGVRELCDRYGAVFILDEIITGFRWHERGAQFVHGIEPDLCTFGKGIANGFPVSALAGKRELMRLGGYVDDADRVFLLSQTTAAEPWMLAAVLASIDVYQREGVCDQLHRIGASLRAGVEQVTTAAGLSEHFRIRGRDCNLVFHTLDPEGNPSQGFRTLVMQELLERGVLAPSFVVSAATDQAAVDQTVAAVADIMPLYAQALESGVEPLLRGRPVRPALRRRG